MRTTTRLVIALCALVGIASTAAAQQKPPARAIVNITGQLYRAQNDNHFTVFLVTPEGVIMSDPINRDFSRWLKSEIATRFKVPVRYVLYTHRDWDHASGGVVFADTAEFVGQQRSLVALSAPAGNPPLTPDAVKMDSNKNGLVEKSEATGALSDRFALFDYDKNGVLSGAEIARGSVSDVYPATITFTDRYTVTLGGKQVTMVYLGNAHADDSAVIYFPAERAVFNADILNVKRLPAALVPTVGDYINAYKTITSLDYDHTLTGHALSGTKKDAVDVLNYLQDLSKGVAAGIGAGKSLDEIQKTLTLDAYKSFERWDTVRTTHIASVYESIMGTQPPAAAGTK